MLAEFLPGKFRGPASGDDVHLLRARQSLLMFPKPARIRRLSRFRDTEFDTFLLIVMPNAGPESSGNIGT